MELEIVYRDDHLIAVNKPNGLLVHRSKIAKDASIFALQLLRNQIGQKVYPCHRLDRKTSGVLIFALDEQSNSQMQKLFADNRITKKYLAIIRGFTLDEELIDYRLKREDGKKQDAQTFYKTLQRTELEIPSFRHQTSRYSLVEVKPLSGRMHQIRKHFAHILHPIIGDRPYGCNKQNRFFKEQWNMISLLLHAYSVGFVHPLLKTEVYIHAKPSPEFLRMMKELEFFQDF